MMEERALPATLYKYTSVENAVRIISDKALWFSSPEQFNDPFDCNINLLDFTPDRAMITDIINEKVAGNRALRRKEITKNRRSPHRIVNQATEQVQDLFYRSGVCCFSAVNANILMWAHYAANHGGVCLGFNQAVAETATMATWVEYQTKFSKVNFWRGEGQAIAHLLLTKAHDWHYEQEIRLIKMLGCGKSAFDIAHLTEVIFGLRTPPDDIARVKELVRSCGHSHITFQQVRAGKGSFCLVIR